jgi:hypothetical protein
MSKSKKGGGGHGGNDLGNQDEGDNEQPFLNGNDMYESNHKGGK